MEFKDIKGVRHYLYESIEEFYEHNENIVVRRTWREGKDNEWVFTDDKHVC